MNKKWFVFWLISLIECFAAAGLIFTDTSEPENTVLFGLSPIRLIMLAAFLTLCGIFGLLMCQSLKQTTWIQKNGETCYSAAGITALIGLFILVLSIICLTPPVGRTITEKTILSRLFPIGFWITCFSLHTFTFYFFTDFLKKTKNSMRRMKNGVIAGLLFLFIALALIGVSFITKWGLSCISGTFYRQGVSLLEGQLVLPILFLFPLLILIERFGNYWVREKRTKTITSILLSAAIWLAVAIIWQRVPFEGRSYFLPAKRLPNMNFYPASDAENYDLLAQSILIGNGFRNGMTVVRPLYAAFLALLHSIAGNDYMSVTDLQIFVIALYPLSVYWIGKLIYRGEVGLLAAAWVTWREVYSIQCTPLVQVSNVRLLMSDMPTALMVSLIILAFLLWLRKCEQPSLLMVTGGLTGLTMLIRTQSAVVIPIILFFIFYYKKTGHRVLQNCVIFIVSVLIIIVPWNLLNQINPNLTQPQNTSEENYLLTLFERIVYEDEELSSRHGEKSIPRLILENPKKIANTAMAHFMNNEISSLLILPEREKAVNNPEKLFSDEDLFWYRENSENVLRKNYWLTFLYIAIISLGICVSWNKCGASSVFPLTVHLIYNAGTAAALNSGFRFILPVDWILLIYFAVGCVSILLFIIIVFLRIAKEVNECQKKTTDTLDEPKIYKIDIVHKRKFVFLMGIVLIIFGAILPIADVAFPYTLIAETDPEKLLTVWEEASEENALLSKKEKFRDRIQNNEIVVLSGRAIYPRYYPAFEGDSGGSSKAKRGLQYSRIVWMLINQRVNVISLPCTYEYAMEKVKDPMDVVVIGEPFEDYIRVIVIDELGKP